MRALALLLVASSASAAPKLASHYAPMFEKGKTFVYDLSVTGFDLVERKDGTYKSVKGKPERSKFTCTVDDVAVFPTMTVSSISCDQEIDSDYAFRVDGTWVATKAGVFRAGGAGGLPASAAEVEVLAAPPIRATPRSMKKRTKDTFGGYFEESVTSPRAGTWCANSDTTHAGAGDGAIETMCFTAGAGITRGMLDYYGGIPRIVEYTLRR